LDVNSTFILLSLHCINYIFVSYISHDIEQHIYTSQITHLPINYLVEYT